MAFAPYTNQYASGKPLIRGRIVNELGNNYEFFCVDRTPFDGYDHAIYVGNCGETRYCKIVKTRAYVVIDEAADGSPVVEKWVLKSRRDYDV